MSNRGIYKWSAIDRILNSVMTFTGNIVLARLLDPSDFGLVAMVAIFTAIAQNLSSCGMSDGLIHKHNPTERDYSTVFVFNAAMGLFFGLLFVALGLPLSLFFNRPQITGIMTVIGVCFFFQTLCFVQETRMRKELDMRRMAIVRLSSTASAITLGIILAANHGGYWALIATQSGLSVFTFIYYMLVSQWMPRIAFYRESFHELFGYGVHLMLAYIVNQIGRNISTSVLGKYASPTASGLFSQAQKLEEVPFALTESIFNWPFFSVLSNETNHVTRVKLSSQMHVRLWFINLSIFTFLLLISWPAFNLLYGAKWDGAIPVFRLLLIYGVATSMKYFYQTVLKAFGRVLLVRNITFIEVIIQLILLAIFYDSGIIMIAVTQVISVLAILIVNFIYYCSTLEVAPRGVIVNFLGSLIVPTIAFGLGAAVAPIWYFKVSHLLNCIFLALVYTLGIWVACEIIKPSYYPPIKSYIISKLKLNQ